MQFRKLPCSYIVSPNVFSAQGDEDVGFLLVNDVEDIGTQSELVLLLNELGYLMTRC